MTFVRSIAAITLLLSSACELDPAASDDDGAPATIASPPVTGFRAFAATSYWNTPLPANAPLAPDSDRLIAALAADSSPKYLNLGVSKFSHPVYWATASDPIKKFTGTQFRLNPELTTGVHVPAGALPADSSDSEMAVYDLATGIVWNTWHTVRRADGSYTAGGSDLWYLGSNGLDGRLAQSNDARNRGHRGYPQAALGYVRLDEIQAGKIEHVLKVALNNTAPCHVFPGVGDESGTGAICEGARLRIKPSVDLSKRALSPAARIVATAAQRYGLVVGDQSGGQFNLKLENTIVEGRGDLWKGVLASSSLSSIPITDFEVIAYGYGK
jgi:hypothetical protein